MTYRNTSWMVLLLAASIGGAGCCKSVEKKAQREAEKQVEKDIAARTDGGVKVKLGSGANLQGLDAQFRYPGANVISRSENTFKNIKTISYTMKTTDSLAKVRAFYEKIKSPKRVSKSETDRTSTYFFGKNMVSYEYMVTVIKAYDGGTRIVALHRIK